MADEAGASIATVFFVLSGSWRGRGQPASDVTVRRVREAAEKLGYVPNEHAKAIRTGYSTAVVLALGSPEDPWCANIVMRRAERQNHPPFTQHDFAWEFIAGATTIETP